VEQSDGWEVVEDVVAVVPVCRCCCSLACGVEGLVPVSGGGMDRSVVSGQWGC
jgi:hypothetical protein